MVTNVTISPVTEVAVVYYQDGTSMTVEPQTTKQLQIIDNGFITVSDTVGAEEGEHPPEAVQLPASIEDMTGVSPEEWFYEKLVRFWTAMRDAVRKEIAKNQAGKPKPTQMPADKKK